MRPTISGGRRSPADENATRRNHVPDLAPRYNIAPTQRVPIVRLDGSGARELVQVKWGLVPRWARDPSIGGRLFNARAETVAQKAAFRAAYARHRCLVPDRKS